ncbi:hypothetical protein BC827DRAFT_1208189 [Russula dissimulans]|nr:hypothetical protein BC827DRAFT_1208189 [Russula dissimulans]
MLGLSVQSLRFAAGSLVLSRTSVLARYPPVRRRDGVRHAAFPIRIRTRTFSTTPRRSAEEAHDEFINAIKHTALFQKLADKPNAIKALSDFYALTKEMGIDVNSMSQFQMFKLLSNRRFLKAVKRVTDELNEAGLKLNSDDAMQEILGLAQRNPHKKDGS